MTEKAAKEVYQLLRIIRLEVQQLREKNTTMCRIQAGWSWLLLESQAVERGAKGHEPPRRIVSETLGGLESEETRARGYKKESTDPTNPTKATKERHWRPSTRTNELE